MQAKINMNTKKIIILTLFVSFGLVAFVFSQEKETFDIMVEKHLSHTVPIVKADTLEANKYVFLDCREIIEFRTSHIKNAKFVGYDHFSFDHLNGVNKNDTIITYCSIGYRSEKIGEKLKEQGYKNVYNLYGGIFDWANLGKKIYNDQNQTDVVHGFNKSWSIWLDTKLVKTKY